MMPKLSSFILKTCSDQILEQLIREVAAALFSLRRSKNLGMKTFLLDAEIDMLDHIWVEKNDSGRKSSILFKLDPFSGAK